MTTNAAYLLAIHLQMQVPLLIHDLLAMPEERRLRTSHEWAVWANDDANPHSIAAAADTLMFPAGSKPGTAGGVVGTLARGLAALALAPGGVTMLGTHWCVEHRAGVVCPGVWELACRAGGQGAGLGLDDVGGSGPPGRRVVDGPSL